MIVNPLKLFFPSLLFFGVLSFNNVYSHGLIENPPSREYFCGKVTKPEHTESAGLAYEECRPVLTKDGKYNGDIYQFMSVLSHSRGYFQNPSPPVNVCGYDTETFQGKASPWDAPINWPINKILPGPKQFTWDISYGPHFSDTEQFRYWITKPDFQFAVGTPLKWSDFEGAPFCDIPWDDNAPDKNPAIWADRANNKFHMVCQLPNRTGRHVIYAEWGRDKSTYERFHSCVDVAYQGQGEDQPPPEAAIVEARIAPSTVKELTGKGVVELNGAASLGDGLTYQWIVNSKNPQLYSINNANQPMASLFLENPTAEENITVILNVSNAQGSSNAEFKLKHIPEQAVTSEWVDLGPLSIEPRTFKEGDQLIVRVVNKEGKDAYYPAQPLIVTQETMAANAWPFALAQAVDQSNAPIKIGVLNEEAGIPQPVNEGVNKIYAQNTANIQSAYLQVTTATNAKCRVALQKGNSEWWAGLDVGTDLNQFKLDFSQTGIDLQQVMLDPGGFTASIEGQVIQVMQKPGWVTINQPGYMGFNATTQPLSVLGTNFVLPTCDPLE